VRSSSRKGAIQSASGHAFAIDSSCTGNLRRGTGLGVGRGYGPRTSGGYRALPRRTWSPSTTARITVCYDRPDLVVLADAPTQDDGAASILGHRVSA
jgi:hypothetical protein